MRLGKVHGRTVTEHKIDGRKSKLVRELSVNGTNAIDETEAPKAVSISEISIENKNLLIGQWISVIDKVFAKPNENKNPSKQQFDLRDGLSKACWEILVEKKLLAESELDDWGQRSHPYGTGFIRSGKPKKKRYAEKSEPGLYGHWRKAFSGEDNECNKIAVQIYNHLHKKELRQDGKNKRGHKTGGLIKYRAKSIRKSVFKPDFVIDFKPPWVATDEKAYIKDQDIASFMLSRLADKTYWVDYPPKLAIRKKVGKLLAEHLKIVTGSKRCSFVKGDNEKIHGSDVEIEHAGVLTLHNAVREHYKKLARSGAKGQKTDRFPKHATELFRQLAQRRENQMTNHLIRIGRIKHYHGEADGFETSHYWTSLGQTQIKETEVFVRIWRGAITQATRSLKAWVDPDGKVTTKSGIVDSDDITGGGNIKEFLDSKALHQSAFDRMPLYFGACEAFCDLEGDQKLKIANACLRHISSCRNNTLHFKTREILVKELSNRLAFTEWGAPDNREILCEKSKNAIQNLIINDQKALNQRLLTDLQSAHVDKYCDNASFTTLFQSIQPAANADDSDVILPGFKKILHRAGTVSWPKLPAAPNLDQLDDDATRARYVGLQMLYDGPFRKYIETYPASDMDSLIEQVKATTAQLAKSANKKSHPYPETILGRDAVLPKMAEYQTVVRYFSKLTEISAQEFKVQKGYESKSENAQKQADFIENFKRDLVIRVFEKFLQDRKFSWLYQIKDKTGATNINPDQITPEENTDPVETWQAGLYLVLHFIPFDAVSRLLHQFKRWGALQNKYEQEALDTVADETQVNRFKQTLALYLKMHDGRIDGTATAVDLTPLRELYQDPEMFNTIFATTGNDTDEVERTDHTRKGLRQILRFNHLPALGFIFRHQKITNAEIKELKEFETGVNGGNSPIKQAHIDRSKIHDDTMIKRKQISSDDIQKYRDAINTIVRHKALVGRVYFGDHLRLHRLMMMVIGRLIDYAGLWERDCSIESRYSSDGFIELAKTHTGVEWTDPGLPQSEQTRNDLAHFNILAPGAEPINLTKLVNRTRHMMQYDRKLKNAVSKSIIEMLEREGIKLEWTMKGHFLSTPRISGIDIRHMAKNKKKGKKIDPPIIEARHNPAFLEMVAILFGGCVKPPVSLPPDNKPRTPKKQTKKRSNSHSKPAEVTSEHKTGAEMTGQVKWFNATKGFGFIAPDGGGKDVFVHITAVEQAGISGLDEDQKVSYNIDEGRDGRFSAVDLHLING